MLHCDISDKNILIAKDNKGVLSDWDLANQTLGATEGSF
jgi:RIO-like serine/threonine protein kinase